MQGRGNILLDETREWNREFPEPMRPANIIWRKPREQPTVVSLTQAEEIPGQMKRIEAAHRVRESQGKQKEG